jgi:DNA-binding response OmpR family regulator
MLPNDVYSLQQMVTRLKEQLAMAENELQDMKEKARTIDGKQLDGCYGILFGLTRTEGLIMNVLMQKPFVTRQAAMQFMYSMRIDDEPEAKIIDVYLCKIRQKLRKFGINVETNWGQGYMITPANKMKVKEFVDSFYQEANDAIGALS